MVTKRVPAGAHSAPERSSSQQAPDDSSPADQITRSGPIADIARQKVLSRPIPKALDAPPKFKPYQCISIDGGSAGLLTVMMLQKIEAKRPGFLAKTKLFAGTSSGSTTALVLATESDPSEKLPDLLRLWGADIMSTVGNSVPGFVSALFGFSSVYTNQPLIETLSKPEYLGSLELMDLKKKVVIAAFDVSPAKGESWEPHAFTNLITPTGRVIKAVDVAISSSAAPVIMPIHNGFVDGGAFANNPSMVAAASIIAATHDTEGPVKTHPLSFAGGGQNVRQMYMLSIAGGKFAPNLRVLDESWGYLQWMANLMNPLLAFNMFFQGGMQAVDFQGQYLFAPNTYHRVDPDYVVQGLGLPWLQANPNDLIATANSKQAEEQVDLAVAWLDTVDWFSD